MIFIWLVTICLYGPPIPGMAQETQFEPINSDLITAASQTALSQRSYGENKKYFNLIGKHLRTKWLVIAGREIYPSSVYRIAIELVKKSRGENVPLRVHASLSHDETQVTSAGTTIQPGDLSEILLKIPGESTNGRWSLSVEGREAATNVLIFRNSTDLSFRPNFLTILIQTSRPVYNAGQNVKFRAILLTRELVAYEEPVDVFVLDPNGNVMRRWPSRQTGEGLSLSFDLPEYPLLGNWTIRVKARQQLENKTILVEQYFRPRFEVFVRLPQSFNIADEYVSGVVVANMTNWRDVYGNCSIKLQLGTNDDFPVPTEFVDVYETFIYNFTGVQEFMLPMDRVQERAGGILDGKVVRVLATVGEAFGWRIEKGWALAVLYKQQVKVEILGDNPIFFSPGMPLTIHVFVSYSDGHPIDEEELLYSMLTVSFSSSTTAIFNFNGSAILDGEGAVEVTAFIPEDAQTMTIAARFSSSSGLTGGDSLMGMRHHSPNNHHIQLETSTKEALIGEYIVLHLRNNFFIDYFNFAVIANGLLIFSGREIVDDVTYPTTTTFTLPASVEMAPVAKFLVWVVDQYDDVIAHSIAIPVNPISRHEVGVRYNEHKDHSGSSFEAKMLGEAGAFFATMAIWEETYLMKSGNDIDESRVLLHMLGMADNYRIDYTNVTVPNVRISTTRSRDGSESKVRLFATANAGPDSLVTFNFSEVMLLTNAEVNHYPRVFVGENGCEEGYLTCITGNCYRYEQRCDGTPDCADLSDEAGCPLNVDRFQQFRLHRLNRLWRFYDSEDGDFGWLDIRSLGIETQVFSVPKRPQSWIFSVFAVGKTSGLGIMLDVIQFDSAGPFMLTVEAPPVARMWEQVGLTVGVFNYHNSQVGVLVTLESSPLYKTVAVEKNGIVDSYNPRTIEGTFQHVVWMPPNSAKDIHIPIVFTQMGSIEVTVVGATQMQGDSQTVVIEVLPEGVKIGKHTSILLDLKDRAIVYEFFNVHLDESPIIPYAIKRRYIFGTPMGHISVTGDVVGPAFPSIPVNSNNLLGFEVMGAETSAFNFAANVYSLHYLRLTNQMTDRIRYKVLEAVNVDLAALVRYQSRNGGFSNWIGSEQSVWLTAHAIKCLWTANFQEWEDYIYIDSEIIRNGISWLMDHQTAYGSFHETEAYTQPLNIKIDPRSRHDWMPKYQNTSLTAHVVLAMVDTIQLLNGQRYTEAIISLKKAVLYLERILDQLDDPYDVSVVTWALTKANSKEKDYAFSLLDVLKIQDSDRVYWSREPVGFHPLIYEDSQRPYLQPKDDQKWDAHSVETTAYALLTYVQREGVGILQENIVRFLASMRELDGGHISSVDSLVAMEALVQYAFRARLREITRMDVIMEFSAEPSRQFHVSLENNEELSTMRSFDLNNLWGHINIRGKGSGQALIQLDYSYGVDIQEELDVPPVPSFEFDLIAKYSGRNSSHMTITSCQRWINTNETETSGLTVVEIHMPSGYYIMQDELIEMALSRRVKNLRWALRTDTTVKFFFNKIENEKTCFTYQLERWYPVSNHSRHNLAWIYDLYQPERFQMHLFEVFSLYVLDICEVCGSYQCVYCPYYSGASAIRGFLSALCIVVPFLSVFIWTRIITRTYVT